MISSQNEILRADDLYHVYDTEAVDGNVVALRGIHIKIDQGEVVSVVGPSGSGKSTLMKCLGGLMKSSAGDVFFEGKSIVRLSSAELLNFRQQTVSFIFQDSNLLPYMNIVNNVALPLKYLKVSPRRARSEAMELLERLGIKDQAKMLPNQISGGEKQRTAIARALITKPKIILADEPTGSVDPVTSRDILNLFREIIDEFSVAFLIVTHSREIAGFADRSLELVDGRFVAEHGMGIDMSNLADTRKIIIDATGNMTLASEILSKIGGPGVFETTEVEKDKISMSRVIESVTGSDSKSDSSIIFCPACGNKYEDSDTEICSQCGALRFE
jgi:ABC-type lipoprotein export system ATPase subunit